MAEFTFSDFVNAFVHTVMAIIYFYFVWQARRAPDLKEDSITFARLTPLAKSASAISGFSSIVIALFMLGLWVYFLLATPQPLFAYEASTVIHALVELLVGVMLLVSGITIIKLWRHSILLYFLSLTGLLTTTLFNMIVYTDRGHPIAMDIIAVSSVTILVITGGIAFTVQYFHLVGSDYRKSKKGKSS